MAATQRSRQSPPLSIPRVAAPITDTLLRQSSQLSWWDRWWLTGVIFFFPTHWFWQLDLAHAYVHGLRVDYLILKIFVTQLMIGGLLLGWAWRCRGKWPQWPTLVMTIWPIGLAGLCLAALQFFSQRPAVGLWQMFNLTLASGLGWYLWEHRQLIRQESWLTILVLANLFHSVIGVGQWWLQGSVFPSYWWFGEPRLLGQPGLATSTWQGRELLLPYGVTAHPNVLASNLVMYLIVMLNHYPSFPKAWRGVQWLSLGFGVVTLGLTNSVTAVVGIIAGLTWWGFSHTRFFEPFSAKFRISTLGFWGSWVSLGLMILLPLWISRASAAFPESSSFVRRAWLADAAWQMWQAHPWTGVGLQQFTAHVEEFAQNTEVVRFVQPVHHVGLLWLSETGLIGVGVLLWLTTIMSLRYLRSYAVTHSSSTKIFTRNLGVVTLVTLPMLLNDHYLLTNPASQIGLVLFVFFVFLSPPE